jgi:hypothetical protein
MNPYLRHLGYGLAAVPAFFLPFAYLIAVGWLCAYALPASYHGEEIPESGDRFLAVTRAGFHALVVQWPVYFGWVLVTRRLTPRLRLLWGGVMVVFSLFAIPWFLFAMWRRSERIELLQYIRRPSVRHYFAKGLRDELPPMRHHLDLPDEYRQVRFRSPVEDVPPEFRILTAHNPEGVVTPPEANEEADTHLRAELDRQGFEYFPVTGGSRDFSHAEPGYGIVCDRAEALLLARRFCQNGFFEVLGGRVYLISVHEAHRPGEYVGRWRDLVEFERPIEGGNDATGIGRD